MDRFSQAQQLMFAEMHALREIAGGGREATCSVFNGACGPPALASDPPARRYSSGPKQVVSKAGREVDGCCAELIFAREQPSSDRRPEPRVPDHQLRNKVRKELEAEFRSKQAAPGRPAPRLAANA
eukprot:TRINITY_DN51442_c0_g1_i1.p2 TRINITY_DN51442_c0_g1~~TRINITY_DN51442_c0_g1_i1.p2  ORF type:complete len:126 (+),score=25.01 TRINITY_DN51442_c0_g1_i1:88-465(+)